MNAERRISSTEYGMKVNPANKIVLSSRGNEGSAYDKAFYAHVGQILPAFRMTGECMSDFGLKILKPEYYVLPGTQLATSNE
ncbi:hypothetical protein ACFLU5_09450 [Bacteroidota bacterium]